MLEDELQLLSSLCVSAPLSQLSVNAYVDYVASLTAPCGTCEVHSLMAVSLHVRLNLWVSNVLLQASPEVGKATRVGRWLEFCCLAVGSLCFSLGRCNTLQFVASMLDPCWTHETYETELPNFQSKLPSKVPHAMRSSRFK